jgi:hypothetical protein
MYKGGGGGTPCRGLMRDPGCFCFAATSDSLMRRGNGCERILRRAKHPSTGWSRPSLRGRLGGGHFGARIRGAGWLKIARRSEGSKVK